MRGARVGRAIGRCYADRASTGTVTASVRSGRVLEFLSLGWIDALDRAVRETSPLPALGASGRIVLEQRVIGAPRGEVTYHLVIESAGARVAPGPVADADLVMITGYESACGINRGSTNAQRELGAGRLKITGDIGALLARADVLTTLGDAFASLRAETVYPDAGVGPLEEPH
jgi:hypothetical protein